MMARICVIHSWDDGGTSVIFRIGVAMFSPFGFVIRSSMSGIYSCRHLGLRRTSKMFAADVLETVAQFGNGFQNHSHVFSRYTKNFNAVRDSNGVLWFSQMKFMAGNRRKL